MVKVDVREAAANADGVVPSRRKGVRKASIVVCGNATERAVTPINAGIKRAHILTGDCEGFVSTCRRNGHYEVCAVWRKRRLFQSSIPNITSELPELPDGPHEVVGDLEVRAGEVWQCRWGCAGSQCHTVHCAVDEGGTVAGTDVERDVDAGGEGCVTRLDVFCVAVISREDKAACSRVMCVQRHANAAPLGKLCGHGKCCTVTRSCASSRKHRADRVGFSADSSEVCRADCFNHVGGASDEATSSDKRRRSAYVFIRISHPPIHLDRDGISVPPELRRWHRERLTAPSDRRAGRGDVTGRGGGCFELEAPDVDCIR